MDVKLLALDIDGTLAENTGSTVPERNLRAVYAAQEAGVYVTLATGRSCVASRHFWELLHILGPTIQFGGAMIVDTRDGSVLEKRLLQPELVTDVLSAAGKLGLRAQVYQGDTVISDRMDEGYLAFIRRNSIPYTVDPEFRLKRYGDVQKVLVFAEPEREPEMRRYFVERFSNRAHIARSMPRFIEINAPGVNKGTALASLAARLGIAREQVAAVGDSYLDQDMIQWAGVGVCMGDGVPEVQSMADVIAPSCGDCGVADFIERTILQKR